jgi:hypothetical protein
MKKTISNIFMTAALLMAGMVVVSCEKENTPVSGTFTMTIDASKANLGGTKALAEIDNTISATWTQNDEVYVYKGEAEIGLLQAQSSGANTTLSGSISGEISKDDILILKFRETPNYTSQNGTLDYIAANCDHAVATVKVTDIISDGSGAYILKTENHVTFQNQQAIVKFILQNAATELRINVDNDETTEYTITPNSATTELFVAIPGISNKSVALTANNSTKVETEVTLENGNYYVINVNM